MRKKGYTLVYMKKYTLFLSVFLLSFIFIGFLGFNANTASADSDCSYGDRFSRITGEACPGIAPLDCQPGDKFSSATGQPCSSTDQDNSSSVSQFNSLNKSYFRIGSTGNEVRALQQFLKDEGYFFGRVDGKYGKITARAVQDFMED